MSKIIIGMAVGGLVGVASTLIEKTKKGKFDYLIKVWPKMSIDVEMLKLMDELYEYQIASPESYVALGNHIEMLIKLQSFILFEIQEAKKLKDNYIRHNINYPLESIKYLRLIASQLDTFSVKIIEYNKNIVKEKRQSDPFFNRYSQEAKKLVLDMENYRSNIAPQIENACISYTKNISLDHSNLMSMSIKKQKPTKNEKKENLTWNFLSAINERMNS